jgi:hypothetical protein
MGDILELKGAIPLKIVNQEIKSQNANNFRRNMIDFKLHLYGKTDQTCLNVKERGGIIGK